jgi:uncharacterized protein YbbC (DUF1343 family)
MKKTMYKLLFALCLFAGVSCSQDNQEEGTSAENENQPAAEADTATVSDDVPESLLRH